MAASPEEQAATMLKNIPEKTGKTLEQWQGLIAQEALEKHGLIVKWLKAEHGVTHGFANFIAAKALDAGEEDDLIAAQYAGDKAALRPLHDAIFAFAKTLGPEVESAPKKASHSLRRKKQFALILPATKTRIDLGLALKGTEPTERLEAYNAMCSHRVRLNSEADFDEEVKTWMAAAFEQAG